MFPSQRSRLTGTATCRSCLMCAACTGRSRGRRPPQCGPRGWHNCAESSGTAASTGGRGRLLLTGSYFLLRSARRPRPPLHLPLHPGRLGGRPGASRTTLWNPAAAGTRPGPEAPRPAAVLPPRSPPRVARTCRAPTLSLPRLGGPRPTPAPLGPAPSGTSARGPDAAAAHFRFPRTA